MTEFDKNKPYGETFGHPYIRYIQDGKNFTAAGKLVPDDDPRITAERDTGVARQERKQAEREALKEAFKAELATGSATTVIEDAPKPTARLLDPEALEFPSTTDEFGTVETVPLEELHWTKLREMATGLGIDYQGKQKTIALIRQSGE
jgi:hypothetical protein